jgi:outer membrane protein assembly factor BamB
MTRRAKFSLLLALTLLLSGCGAGKWFTDEDKAPLKGERIAVLQLQKDLTPDPALQSAPAVLPEAWENKLWPQAGGYPNHAMGHLALGAKLQDAWHESIGAGGDRRTPLTAAPVAAEGVIYTLDTEGQISAFSIKNGDVKWRQSTVPRGEDDSGTVGGGLAYSEGRLYATNGYKQLLALNPATGAQMWKVALPSPARSAPTVADGRVYVITLDNRLLAFSSTDGAPLWNYAGVAEDTNLLGSASVAADKTLVVLPLSSGELFGLRPENGRIAWEDNLSAVRRMGALASIADIRGLPVIDQGVVFAVSYSGRLVALDAATGKRLWQREVGSAETPWPAGDSIFMVTTEQQLAAFARQGGGIRWNVQLPRYDDDDRESPIVWTGPVLAGGRLIVASSGGEMLEISPQDGKTIRKTKLDGDVMIAPIVVDGTLFILAQDGRLTAYR